MDADNKAGLKTKYELREFLAEAMRHMRTREVDKARAVLAKARTLPDLTEAQKASIESLSKVLEPNKSSGDRK